MKVMLRGNKVGIEKYKKPVNSPGFIVMPQSEEYFGIVRYIGNVSPELKVGQQVYFGTNFQSVKINGTDICVMTEDQVLAIVED